MKLIYDEVTQIISKLLLAVFAVLTWLPSTGEPVDGYRIYQALTITGPFSLLATVDSKTLTYTVDTPKPGTCFRVTAFNVAGESQASNNACLFVVIPSPSSLTIK